jgi:sec-independent protein translocase protein TatC
LAPFKLALYLAVYCAAPVMLYQIWGFIAPGLYKNEKKLVAPLLLSSIFLFYAGMAFAYYIVFPLIFGFFTTVGPTGVTVMTDIDAYLSFVLKLFLAFGLAFEIPIATMLLVKAGVADVKSLKSKRPYVFLGCFVVGMLVTPPDMISQTLLAVPMWLLFEAGLIGARFLGPPRGSDTAAEEAAADNTENAKTNGVDDSDSETHDIQEFDLYASITDPSEPQSPKDADTDVGPEPPKSGA